MRWIFMRWRVSFLSFLFFPTVTGVCLIIRCSGCDEKIKKKGENKQHFPFRLRAREMGRTFGVRVDACWCTHDRSLREEWREFSRALGVQPHFQTSVVVARREGRMCFIFL